MNDLFVLFTTEKGHSQHTIDAEWQRSTLVATCDFLFSDAYCKLLFCADILTRIGLDFKLSSSLELTQESILSISITAENLEMY